MQDISIGHESIVHSRNNIDMLGSRGSCSQCAAAGSHSAGEAAIALWQLDGQLRNCLSASAPQTGDLGWVFVCFLF